MSNAVSSGGENVDVPGRFAPDLLYRAAHLYYLEDATQAEIAVLKGIVAAFVMQSDRRRPTYRRQRGLLTELLHTLWESGAHELEPAYAADFRAAESEAAARRAIVDQVASLTDQSAIAWYQRLCTAPLV